MVPATLSPRIVFPAERAAIYDALNVTIGRLHGFDPAAIGLADYGRGENYVARQVERWSKQYRASETQTIDDMERLMAWLPGHLPPPAYLSAAAFAALAAASGAGVWARPSASSWRD